MRAGAVLFTVMTLVAGLYWAYASDQRTSSQPAGMHEPGVVTVTREVDNSAFSTLSKREQLATADALVVLAHERDDAGAIVPIVTQVESRPGANSGGHRLGERYQSDGYDHMLSMIGAYKHQAGEGALVLLVDGRSSEASISIIRNGVIDQGMNGDDIPVEDAIRLFRHEPVELISRAPAQVIEPDLDGGEDSSISIDVTGANKEVLVGLLETQGLRHQVLPSDKGYLVTWVGEGEEVDAVMEAYIAICE